MEKTELKKFFNNTAIGTEFNIVMVGDAAVHSGNYKLMEIAVGRGKCGSKIAKIMNLETGNVLDSVVVDGRKKSFGTPVSDLILNITVGSTVFGTIDKATDNSFPYPRDEAKANALKAAFAEYSGKENVSIPLRIKSPESWLAGTWRCTKVSKNPGRQGQLTLELQAHDGSGKSITLWTYRHSGGIEDLELLEEEN